MDLRARADQIEACPTLTNAASVAELLRAAASTLTRYDNILAATRAMIDNV